MDRKYKLELLDKAFNHGDLSSLEDTTKKPSIVLDIRQDEGLKRQETATHGNQLTLWNYSEDEAETVREKLKTQYEIVWVTQYQTV